MLVQQSFDFLLDPQPQRKELEETGMSLKERKKQLSTTYAD